MKKSNKKKGLGSIAPQTSKEYTVHSSSFTVDENETSSFGDNVQTSCSKRYISWEKQAEMANRSIRENKGNVILPTDAAPSDLRREYLQTLVDTRCGVITQHYYEENAKLHEAFDKASVNISTAQYPIVGSAPHEIEFLDQSSSLMRRYTAELRELRGICNSFGLRTNPLLDRVFGCNAQ